jgi:hypothetical protein
MAAALIAVCVDPRLNHELIRLQVRQKLERSGLRADQIFIVNEVGGQLGANFRHTAELVVRSGDSVVFCAVLHHDDCLAVREAEVADLAATAQQMAAELAKMDLPCPVVTGQIRTEHTQLLWSDEPESRYVPFTFGSG